LKNKIFQSLVWSISIICHYNRILKKKHSNNINLHGCHCCKSQWFPSMGLLLLLPIPNFPLKKFKPNTGSWKLHQVVWYQHHPHQSQKKKIHPYCRVIFNCFNILILKIKKYHFKIFFLIKNALKTKHCYIFWVFVNAIMMFGTW
jgi:hypothetical protein